MNGMVKRFAVLLAALLLVAACGSEPPHLPSADHPSTVMKLVTGDEGTAFLERICNYAWSDEGVEAAHPFDWILSSVSSADRAVAESAGKTAHALASFVADHSDSFRSCTDRNPELSKSIIAAMVPYQSAMVGDPTGTAGFAPLDPFDSNMPRTASLFSAVQSLDAFGMNFVGEARNRADRYEEAFAVHAAADPLSVAPAAWRDELQFSARLLGVIARAEQAHGGASLSLVGPRTQLEYAVISRMIRRGDPRISSEYFGPEGVLISPEDIESGQSSLYSAQLSNVLSNYPGLSAAINEFNSTYLSIVNS